MIEFHAETTKTSCPGRGSRSRIWTRRCEVQEVLLLSACFLFSRICRCICPVFQARFSFLDTHSHVYASSTVSAHLFDLRPSDRRHKASSMDDPWRARSSRARCRFDSRRDSDGATVVHAEARPTGWIVPVGTKESRTSACVRCPRRFRRARWHRSVAGSMDPRNHEVGTGARSIARKAWVASFARKGGPASRSFVAHRGVRWNLW